MVVAVREGRCVGAVTGAHLLLPCIFSFFLRDTVDYLHRALDQRQWVLQELEGVCSDRTQSHSPAGVGEVPTSKLMLTENLSCASCESHGGLPLQLPCQSTLWR